MGLIFSEEPKRAGKFYYIPQLEDQVVVFYTGISGFSSYMVSTLISPCRGRDGTCRVRASSLDEYVALTLAVMYRDHVVWGDLPRSHNTVCSDYFL